MRGYLVVEKNLKNKFFEVCFDAYWRDNMDILDEKNLDQILTTIGLDKNSFLQNIENQEVKDMLKKLTNDAFEKEVFVSSTFIVNNKIFWGQDRLEYALEELN